MAWRSLVRAPRPTRRGARLSQISRAERRKRARIGGQGGAPADTDAQAASNDNLAKAVLLDQYYTREDVAKMLYEFLLALLDLTMHLMVEPSAGTGAFFKLLPSGSRGYDKEPNYPGIREKDFLTVELPRDRLICVVGNPPFGKNAKLAIKFFNHAAAQCDVIAFIVPGSFRKASVQKKLNLNFHLLAEKEVPKNAFVFKSQPFDVSTVFQVWVRRPMQRQLPLLETAHSDFEFTTADRADFAITRIGARAGRVHDNLEASKNSTYFIKGDVKDIMSQLDFKSVIYNVASNPSLAKSELVRLYREKTGR